MYFLLYHDKGSLLKMNTAINAFNLLKFNIHRITVFKMETANHITIPL